ncbi:MAG: hypothetical protein AAGA87_08860 [Pseudomonadota bacterium]
MAEQDSFISEVTEEVRRDRMFRLIRRYGWIVALVIIGIVGGAAWFEWRKAQAEAAARDRGDAVLAALEQDSAEGRANAISAIEGEGSVSALLAMLAAAQSENADTAGAAIDRLSAVAGDQGLDPVYRDLATLKLLEIDDTVSADDRIARLEPLTVGGAPYRALALEAIALSHVEAGRTEEALKILTDLLSDSDATQGLRNRASQLIVALGGELDAG